MDGVIRRKVAAARVMFLENGPGADRAWRVALARAANGAMALPMVVDRLAIDRRTLAELLEILPERALIAVVEGPGESLGIVALSPPVLAAMIEMQTMGRVSSGPPPARRPTRTDAAMVAGIIDLALEDMETTLEADPDLAWAGGFRYASFLDDPRPLGLLLEDVGYRVLLAEVSLAGGSKAGPVLLALPADGRGRRPAPRVDPVSEAAAGAAFSQALADQVLASQAQLAAVLHRITIPLSAVMGLQPGDLVPLPMAALDRIMVEGSDGRRMAEGRLGQNRGMRAVRLTPVAAPAEALPVAALRATGTG